MLYVGKYAAAYNDPYYDDMEFLTDIFNHLGLTDREKVIFKLKSEGYKQKEIARMTGLSKERISQIWSGLKNRYFKL